MLIAVDTNVLIDQADGNGDVIDALDIIRKRLMNAVFVVTPTVLFELGWGFENDDDPEVRRLCGVVADELLNWRYEPMNFIPVGHGIVEQIAFKLRNVGIIPDEEENDSQIIAEAALLGCEMLLSSDRHMLGAHENGDFHALLRDSDVDGDKLVIAKPALIARKFFVRK